MFGGVGAVVEFFDGRFVPQVHEEDLALAEDLVDQLIEQVAPELEGDGLVTQAHEGIFAELVEPHVQRQEDVLLRLEVVVEGGLGDAQPVGDLPQAGAVVAHAR